VEEEARVRTDRSARSPGDQNPGHGHQRSWRRIPTRHDYKEVKDRRPTEKPREVHGQKTRHTNLWKFRWTAVVNRRLQQFRIGRFASAGPISSKASTVAKSIKQAMIVPASRGIKQASRKRRPRQNFSPTPASNGAMQAAKHVAAE